MEGIADAVIPKPFEIGLLRETVERLVSQEGAGPVNSGW